MRNATTAVEDSVAPKLDWTELHQLLSDPHESTEAEVLAAIERHPEQARVQHAVRRGARHFTVTRPKSKLTRASSACVGRQGLFLPAHFAAAFFGSKPVCERLHEVYPEGTRARSKIGSLPLHLAAHNGRLEAVRALVAACPEAAEAEDGWQFTPVDLAWRKGHWAVVEVPDSATENGFSEGTLAIARAGRFVAGLNPAKGGAEQSLSAPETCYLLDGRRAETRRFRPVQM